MKRSGVTAPSARVVRQISAAVSSVDVTRGRLAAIQQQVKAPQGQEECVIESLFRCAISADIQRRYGIPRARIPLWINSSHVRPRAACFKPGTHEHLQANDDSFNEFRRRHRVDFYEESAGRKPALRRADLFVIAADGPVSIEFKYLKPGKALNKGACLQQMKYYFGHAATLLVVYAAKQLHPHLMKAVESMREDLQGQAQVVLAQGPPVIIL